MSLHQITKNVTNLLASISSPMKGGARALESGPSLLRLTLLSILVFLVILFIQAYIVHLLYNIVVPKLIYSLSTDKTEEEVNRSFKPLSFIDCLGLILLLRFLI